MSLELLENGWKRYGVGRRWRCAGPKWFCEVDREGNTPNYLKLTPSVNVVRKVRAFYQRKIFTSLQDEHGNLVDLLTANAMAESAGTVPTPFSREALLGQIKASKAATQGLVLDELIEYIKMQSKYLVRKEPKYSDPLSTPGKISVGAHQMLLSTALEMKGQLQLSGAARDEAIKNLIVGLASDSMFAAELALTYFKRKYSNHQLEPPLMAAVYNAGSLRPSAANQWNLTQYGDHIDRWVAFYNTSRSIS